MTLTFAFNKHCFFQRVSGWDCGDEAALWMTSFLNKNCRLIEHDKQDGRTCKWEGLYLFYFDEIIKGNA